MRLFYFRFIHLLNVNKIKIELIPTEAMNIYDYITVFFWLLIC